MVRLLPTGMGFSCKTPKRNDTLDGSRGDPAICHPTKSRNRKNYPVIASSSPATKQVANRWLFQEGPGNARVFHNTAYWLQKAPLMAHAQRRY